jgi:S1-C subfamily serine protease
MRRKLALGLALAGAIAAAVGVHAALAHTSKVTVQTGVVVVETNLAYQNGAAAGTGMVLTSSGEVLTNNHVIRGATTIKVIVPQTKKTYTARVLGYDLTADVALLQLKNASGLSTVSIGDSSKVTNGQSVTAVGNAGGTGSLTVTTGTITGVHRTITVSDDQGGAAQLRNLVETNASLQPGDSGGPLLDSADQVVGMDSAASAGFSFQQSGSDAYAIPIDTAMTIAKQIAAGRSSTQVHVGGTAFLGVDVQPSGYFRGGVFVAGEAVGGVVPGSPAAKAGIVAGDVITTLNGHAVNSPTAVISQLLPRHPGDKVTVKWVDRSTGTHTASVTLASGPPQ